MNKKFIILLIFCIIIIGIQISGILSYPESSWFVIIVLFSIPFLIISIIFGFVFSYNVFKRKIISEPLKAIREKIIKRDNVVWKDGFGFVSFSMMFSFTLFILFSFTPILDVLNSSPIFQMLGLPDEFKQQISDAGSNSNQIFVVLGISYIGPATIFSLRHFHYKLTILEPRFPGSRPFLGTLYSTLIVVLTHNILKIIDESSEINIPGVEFNETNLWVLIIFGFGFSTIIWFSEWLIFAKLNKK